MISLDSGSPQATIHLDMGGKGVGARIQKAREDKGWTQSELARRAEIHRVSLANIERGAKVPSLATLIRLAKVLRVPLSSLLKGGL